MIYQIQNVEEGQETQVRGVDMGGKVTMWRKLRNTIVLKVAGGGYWSAIGQTSYSPTHFMVCTIATNESDVQQYPEIDGFIVINSEIEFGVRKPGRLEVN